MGLEKIGTTIGKEIIAWTRTGTSLLAAKPVKINTCGLKYVQNLTHDSVSFTNNYYLSEPFVRSLTKIKGKDHLDTMRMVKDLILKRMGYKHPEILKLDVNSSSFELSKKLGADGGYSLSSGKLAFSHAIINLPIENQIPFLFHELDHMDKSVKLYKAVGEKQFNTYLIELQMSSPLYKAFLKKGITPSIAINCDFYRKMSEGINIQNFDVHKWIKAVREYSSITPNYCDKYKYFNNPLEISAYNLESKIKKILGLPIETAKDMFPKNYKSMVEALKSQGITNIKEQECIIKNIIPLCQMKNIDDKLVKLYINKINGIKLTSEELSYIEKTCSDFNKNNRNTVDFFQKACLDAETYFRKGLLTIDKIADNMLS